MKSAQPLIGLIGGGNMGAAILSGIYPEYPVRVCEQDKKRRLYLQRTFKISLQDLDVVLKEARVIILAVKPQNFDELLQVIQAYPLRKRLFISIAAGITTSYIEKRLGPGAKVVRTMPNLPAQIGQGVTAVCAGRSATSSDVRLACRILGHIGKTVVVEEKRLDAVTAVSGSGPAYVFLFIECLEKAAQSLGLDKDLSKTLIRQTLAGSLNLLERQGEEASVLRAQVTSKGGTTQAALDVFMKHHWDKIFQEALQAAKERAKELAQ